jgi:hypothetical protein
MAYLIPAGAIITLLGLVGLLWCIAKVTRARKSGASNDELNAVMQSIVPVNLAALLVSALGLIVVITGIMLK